MYVHLYPYLFRERSVCVKVSPGILCDDVHCGLLWRYSGQSSSRSPPSRLCNEWMEYAGSCVKLVRVVRDACSVCVSSCSTTLLYTESLTHTHTQVSGILQSTRCLLLPLCFRTSTTNSLLSGGDSSSKENTSWSNSCLCSLSPVNSGHGSSWNDQRFGLDLQTHSSSRVCAWFKQGVVRSGALSGIILSTSHSLHLQWS